jgi:putative two-component system response regulator
MDEDRKKVIIADNNPVNLTLAKDTLSAAYEVFTVPDAESLFQFLETNLPDIILLDASMPEIDGYEAIRILKNDFRTAGIPVIFLTSTNDPPSELRGLTLGAVDYISKPFSPPILLKRVEVHVLMETQKRELRRANESLRQKVEEKTGEILGLQSAVLKIMSDLIEYRDHVTGGHIERTEIFLSYLMEEMLVERVYHDIISSWDARQFLLSAHLHDVGKIAIRNRILLKPGPLTTDEFHEMKRHTTFGEKVIERIQRNSQKSIFLSHAKIMAGTHHEKWDGSGYPRGMSGQDIPLQGRLMAIVDVYDALISERPYKRAFSPEEAIEMIRQGRGTHFEPVLVDIFTAAAKRFYR